tara:strand:- start:922 stop:2094 length:1173 start_codon:yes stop_codon:yes gene_type:complete
MSQTKTQLVANVPSGFNVTGVVTATKFDGALATNATGTNLTLSGDLTVQGSQTIINSDTLDVKDKTVGIASTATPTSATQDGSGIEIYGPSNVTIKYDDQKGGIGINTGLTVTGVVTATSFSGAGSGLTGIDKIEEGNTTAEVVDTGSGGHFKISTEGSERVRVVSSGKVGLGTDNPTSELHVVESGTGGTVHGSAQIALERNGTNYLQFMTGNTGTSGILFGDVADADGAKVAYDHNVGQMQFNTGAVQRLHITEQGGFNFRNNELVERVNITAGKLSDNQNVNLDNGMVHYFTTQETTTSTPNITATAGINTIMSTGDTMVVTLITTAAAGAYSAQLTIEGAATTENWIGGEVPAAGGASGVDIYSYTIIKTGSAAYTVIGNLSKTSA